MYFLMLSNPRWFLITCALAALLVRSLTIYSATVKATSPSLVPLIGQPIHTFLKSKAAKIFYKKYFKKWTIFYYLYHRHVWLTEGSHHWMEVV